MATLAEIRAQYPEYSDLSDNDLAEGLYRKFYADMPREEFDAKVGLAAAPIAEPTGPFKSSNAMGPEAYSGRSFGPNNPLPGAERTGRLMAENTVSAANSVLGAPVDFASMVLNAPAHLFNIPAKLAGYEGVQPPVQNPVGGSQWLQNRTADVAGAVAPGYAPIAETDMTPWERGVKNATEFGAQGMAGGAGLARTAATRLANPNILPRLGDSMLKTYGERPVAAVAMDTGAGMGSGIGATIAQEHAPDSPVAEFLGSLVGAPVGAGATRMAEGLGGMLKGLFDRAASTGALGSGQKARVDATVIPNDPNTPLVPTRGRVIDQARDAVQGVATNKEQAVGNLRDSMRMFDQEGMPQPTAGLQTNDIGVIGLEQSARRANSKPFIESDARVQASASDQVAQARPDVPDADMSLPQQMAKDRKAKLMDMGESRVQRTEDRLNQTNQAVAANDQANATLAAPVRAEAGGARRAEASRQLDEQVGGALDERTKTRKGKYEAIDPNAEIEVDATPLRDTIAKMRDESGALSPDTIPADLAKRLDGLSGKDAGPMSALTGEAATPGKKVTLRDLVDVQKFLNTAGDNAQKAGNFDLSTNIRTLKKQIGDVIKKHPESAEAVAYDKEKYAPYFREGAGKNYRDKVQRDPNGRMDLPPERVAAFFMDSTEDNATHLAKIMQIAPDPASAQRAARSYLISDLARSATNPDGTVNPAMVREWLSNNRGKLTSPELAPIHNEIEQLQRNVLNNRAAGDALNGEVTRLGTRLRQIAKTNKELERAIDNGALGTLIKNSPINAAKEVLSPGGDPVARAAAMNKALDRAPPAIRQRVKDAWGAAVVDAIQERVSTTKNAPGTDTAALSHAALVKHLDQNAELLKEVFRGDPDKLRKMNNARTALEILSRRSQQATTGSVTSEATKQSEQYNLMIEAGLKAYYGVLKGGGLNRTWNVLKRTILRDDSPDVARLLERAFTEDPRILEKLLTRERKAPNPGYNSRLNRAIGVKEAATDDAGDEQRRANQR